MARRLLEIALLAAIATGCSSAPTGARAGSDAPPSLEPPTTEPATVAVTCAEPMGAEPATAEPATIEPATAEPATAEPATAEPATAEPATAEPATERGPTTIAAPGSRRSGYGISIARAGDPTAPGSPRVRLGELSVRGAISRDAVRRVTRRALAQVRFCYEWQLASSPALEGRVTASYVIALGGSVGEVTIRDETLHSPGFDECLETAIRRWLFPSPPEGFAHVDQVFLLDRIRR